MKNNDSKLNSQKIDAAKLNKKDMAAMISIVAATILWILVVYAKG